MKLFQQKSNKLNEVNQVPFKLEKDIQSLVEGNAETIFNLRFIKSELSIDKYRIIPLTIVKSQFPIVTDQSIILSENELMGEYIREQLNRYERKRNRKHYYHISSDSAMPDEFLH